MSPLKYSRLDRIALSAAILALAFAILFSECRADNNTISVDLGYVYTGSHDYGDGFTYGISLVEGKRRLNLAIVARVFSNSISYLAPDNKRKFQEDHRDFFVAPGAAFCIKSSNASTMVSLGLGLEVHFLSATKHHLSEQFSQTARESRLGLGVYLRYYRRMEILSGTAFVAMLTQSWTQKGSKPIDPYEYVVPTEPIHALTLTVGIGFGF